MIFIIDPLDALSISMKKACNAKVLKPPVTNPIQIFTPLDNFTPPKSVKSVKGLAPESICSSLQEML